MFDRTRLSISVLLGIVLTGCGSGRYHTAAVSGHVTLDGQPLAGARITFYPVHDPKVGASSGPEASAETDAEGRYELTTIFGDHGAMIGPNRVTITSLKTEPDPGNPDGRPKVLAPERVPEKYLTGKESLTFEVPAAGTQVADFHLISR